MKKVEMIYVVKPKTTFTKWFKFGKLTFMVKFPIPKFMR